MIKEAIKTLVSGHSLNTDEAALVMEEIMQGEATQAQFGAFVTALRFKGETVDEIVGLAKTMRAKALPLSISEPVVDTCGTGGDHPDFRSVECKEMEQLFWVDHSDLYPDQFIGSGFPSK